MKKWSRWQDWVALIVGVYAFLSPIWTETNTTATWTLVILGALTAAASVWSLAYPGSQESEYVHAGLGVLLFVSPWVLDFTALTVMAWTAWIAGAIIVAVGLFAIPVANRAHSALTAH